MKIQILFFIYFKLFILYYFFSYMIIQFNIKIISNNKNFYKLKNDKIIK